MGGKMKIQLIMDDKEVKGDGIKAVRVRVNSTKGNRKVRHHEVILHILGVDYSTKDFTVPCKNRTEAFELAEKITKLEPNEENVLVIDVRKKLEVA